MKAKGKAAGMSKYHIKVVYMGQGGKVPHMQAIKFV
jgi:hypothetical protein